MQCSSLYQGHTGLRDVAGEGIQMGERRLQVGIIGIVVMRIVDAICRSVAERGCEVRLDD